MYFFKGDIIHQEEISINDKILQPELHNTLANMGAEALVKCIERLPDCLNTAYPQSEENSSYGEYLNLCSFFLFMPNLL